MGRGAGLDWIGWDSGIGLDWIYRYCFGWKHGLMFEFMTAFIEARRTTVK